MSKCKLFYIEPQFIKHAQRLSDTAVHHGAAVWRYDAVGEFEAALDGPFEQRAGVFAQEAGEVIGGHLHGAGARRAQADGEGPGEVEQRLRHVLADVGHAALSLALGLGNELVVRVLQQIFKIDKVLQVFHFLLLAEKGLAALYLLDIHLPALLEPGLAAAAVGAGLAVFDCRIGLLARVAPGHGRYGLADELRALDYRRFLSVPVPAVDKVVRNDAGDLAELERDGTYPGHIVLPCNRVDLFYYIGDDTQFVHNFLTFIPNRHGMSRACLVSAAF